MMRLSIALAAWCALGASGTFLFFSHQQITDRQARHRAFETRLEEISTSLVAARAAQYAYVADGQNVSAWIPRAAAHLESAAQLLDNLRQTASAVDARRTLTEARDLLTEVPALDRQAKDYLASGERLMASDVVFSASAATLEQTGQLVQQAGAAEEKHLAEAEAGTRRDQMVVGASAVAFLALAVALLAFIKPRSTVVEGETSVAPRETRERGERPKTKDLSVLEALRNLENSEEYAKVIKPPRVLYPSKAAEQSQHLAAPVAEHSTAPVPQHPASVFAEHPTALAVEHSTAPAPEHSRASASAELLSELATLCVSFDAVETEESLQEVLARAAALADAPRLAVWLEDTVAGAFQPVTAHGYSPQALARMPAVGRNADNAVAHAGQTRSLQVVPAPAPGARGALVAPLVNAGTAFGVVTVELSDGRESSPTTQAVVTVLATQLAHIFAPAQALAEPDRQAQTA